MNELNDIIQKYGQGKGEPKEEEKEGEGQSVKQMKGIEKGRRKLEIWRENKGGNKETEEEEVWRASTFMTDNSIV